MTYKHNISKDPILRKSFYQMSEAERALAVMEATKVITTFRNDKNLSPDMRRAIALGILDGTDKEIPNQPDIFEEARKREQELKPRSIFDPIDPFGSAR